MRRLLLVLSAIAARLAVDAQLPSRPAWRTLARVAIEPAPDFLPVPVEGVRPAMLADTFGAPRPGGRRHHGIDIFA